MDALNDRAMNCNPDLSNCPPPGPLSNDPRFNHEHNPLQHHNHQKQTVSIIGGGCSPPTYCIIWTEYVPTTPKYSSYFDPAIQDDIVNGPYGARVKATSRAPLCCINSQIYGEPFFYSITSFTNGIGAGSYRYLRVTPYYYCCPVSCAQLNLL